MSFRQVDISAKPVSLRTATATGRIKLKRSTVELVRKGRTGKGDPLSLAKITGVMAAKRTPELVALCHPLKIESTQIETTLEPGGVRVTATVSAREKTGVEMEALTAVAVALLNIWDVVKPYEKDEHGQYQATAIDSIKVVRKEKKPV